MTRCEAVEDGKRCPIQFTPGKSGGARGLCPKHYRRFRRHGHTDTVNLVTDEETKSFSVAFPFSLYEAIVDRAGATGKQLADVVRAAVASYLAKP